MSRLVPVLLMVVPVLALADAPRAPILSRYQRLISDSPFTSKPPPPTGALRENPLNDFALGGVSQLADGYFVILINKKSPSERQTIRPGGPNDYEVVGVDWAKESWKDTTVTIRHGSDTATIGFDDKTLALSSPAPQVQTANRGPQGGGMPPGMAPPGGSNESRGSDNEQRRPRPRVVLPPPQR